MSRHFGHVGVLADRIWYFILILIGTTGILRVAAFYAKFVQLGNVDMKFDESIALFSAIPLISCCARCVTVDACVYISYHGDQKLCQIHEINKTATQAQNGWKIYYKVLDEQGKTNLDLMIGANASQSSTYVNYEGSYVADLALDGDFSTAFSSGTCCATNDGNSYWIMQFGMSGVVDKVDIHLRSDYVQRNSNRTMLVAQSYDDAVNNVGMECGQYFGPLIVTPPFLLTIHCSSPLYGSFLRITYVSWDFMEICEVVAYTP